MVAKSTNNFIRWLHIIIIFIYHQNHLENCNLQLLHSQNYLITNSTPIDTYKSKAYNSG